MVSPAVPAAAPSAMHGTAGYGFGSSAFGAPPRFGAYPGPNAPVPTAGIFPRAGFGSLSSDENEDSDDDGDGDAAMVMVDAQAPSQLQAGSVLLVRSQRGRESARVCARACGTVTAQSQHSHSTVTVTAPAQSQSARARACVCVCVPERIDRWEEIARKYERVRSRKAKRNEMER